MSLLAWSRRPECELAGVGILYPCVSMSERNVLPFVSSLGQAVVATVKGGVRLSCECGSASCLGLGVLPLFIRVNPGELFASLTLVLRGSEGIDVYRSDCFIVVTGCMNKTFPGSFYRLRRGVMVRMRRGESILKVQWRFKCLVMFVCVYLSRCSFQLVLIVDEFYFGMLVFERKVENSFPERFVTSLILGSG
ncbi:hypothetical protein HID58_068105, partial [Brassica napus]